MVPPVTINIFTQNNEQQLERIFHSRLTARVVLSPHRHRPAFQLHLLSLWDGLSIPFVLEQNDAGSTVIHSST